MLLMQLGIGLGGYISLSDYDRRVARAVRIAFRCMVGTSIMLVALQLIDSHWLLLPVLTALVLVVLAVVLPPSSSIARYLRHMHWVCSFVQLLDLTTVCDDAATLSRVYVSDGAHGEPTGLLPLLARRASTIVLCDSGEDLIDECMRLIEAVRVV
jgi:hypothetical protein